VSVERVQELLESLPSSNMPAGLRIWLRRDLEGWQQGRDLEIAVCLNVLPMPLSEREQYIRACIVMAPGESLAARITISSNASTGIRSMSNRQAGNW
jgi:hypothetical protein